jgi:excisionase family DNA binding protein
MGTMSTHIQDETLHPTARRRRKPRGEKLPPGERLLGVREAAAMLALKPGTLYQWAYERKIPVVKLFGRALRFRLSAIEKIIAEFERPALSSSHGRSGESTGPDSE